LEGRTRVFGCSVKQYWDTRKIGCNNYSRIAA
jgi:hypothetical protein